MRLIYTNEELRGIICRKAFAESKTATEVYEEYENELDEIYNDPVKRMEIKDILQYDGSKPGLNEYIRYTFEKDKEMLSIKMEKGVTIELFVGEGGPR